MPKQPIGTIMSLTWEKSRALPHLTKPAELLDCITTRRATADIKTAATTLQGVVNRETPRILVYEKNYKSENWACDLGLNVRKPMTFFALAEKYKNEIKGLVVYDENAIDTVNLATTLAGFHDAIAVSPALAETLSAAPYGFKVLEDLREHGFKSRLEVYKYALKKIWPKCSHRLIIGLDPADKGHRGYLRDLAAAGRFFTMWLDPRVDKEAELIKKFFADTTPAESYYAGWWPEEGAGVKIGSEHGIPTVPADYFENYTVYSGMSDVLNTPTIPAKPKLENKFYVAFMVSDGDNIQYCEHAMKDYPVLWPHEERGQFPISWTASPVLLDAAPQMLNYYYRTSTDNDLLISGPSGAGYTDPQRWTNPEELAAYCRRSNDYFSRTGFNFIAAWNFIKDEQDDIYGENMPELVGMSIQERFEGQETSKLTANGLPQLTAHPRYDGDEPRVLRIITEVIEQWDGKKPAFIAPQIVSWEMGVSGINRCYKALRKKFGSKVEFVRADHLAMLYREAHGAAYNVALRAKVTSSGDREGYSAANATDGSISRNGMWMSDGGKNPWVKIDLKTVCKNERVIISLAEWAGFDRTNNLRDFEIEYSIDGKSWVVLDNFKDNEEGYISKDYKPFDARYIRIAVTDTGADDFARIGEVQVMGK